MTGFRSPPGGLFTLLGTLRRCAGQKNWLSDIFHHPNLAPLGFQSARGSIDQIPPIPL